MLTKKQANKLRGKLNCLLQVADDYSHKGSMCPADAQYVEGDYLRLKREFLDEIKNLTRGNEDDQAKCWRFINHKDYICCGPYNTFGEYSGYSVGLQKKGMSVNGAIMGRGETLEDAVSEAIKTWKEK